MALISPGVQVTVSDESQYTPTAAGSIAYVLLATAQDKRTPTGALATYTTKATAEKVYVITSQRDLVQKYGNIEFKVDAADNPIHGDERNEYGLLAAYSALGVANQLYVQRADVNLDEIEGTSIRPTGEPTDGTYWLDVSSNTNWGIYEWAESNTFSLISPRVITSTSELNAGVPLSSVGAIGDYAVVATSTSNPIYYKRYDNTWVLVGSDDWKTSVPTIVGAIANPANLAIGQKLVINSTNITLTSTTVAGTAVDIAAAGVGKGFTATVNSVGQIQLRATSSAASSGNLSLPDGKLTIAQGSTIGATDCAIRLGLFNSTLDGTSNVKTVFGPSVTFADYRNVPAWRTSDATPRPVGSVWFKTSSTGNGISWAIKEYLATTQSWALQAAPVYASDNAAIYGLDPIGGGGSLGVGTLYIKYDTESNNWEVTDKEDGCKFAQHLSRRKHGETIRF
jgi:hypothetical protein